MWGIFYLKNGYFLFKKCEESKGFEPMILFSMAVFKTAALNHSASSPFLLS